MARDYYETTIALPDGTGVLKALSGVKVSVVPRGASDVAGSVIDIFQADTGVAKGPDPKAGATGTNPFTSGASGAVRFWAEGPAELDIVFEDTIVPARLADRIGWNCYPAKPGTFPTTFLAADGGILQAHLAPQVVNNEVPIGGIIEWWRPAASVPVPAGFVVCDGSPVAAGQHDFPGIATGINVPDLRNVFILGADQTKGHAAGATGTSSDATADAPGVAGTGGSNAHTLTTAQLANHNHGGATGGGVTSSNSPNNHTHSGGTGGMNQNAVHSHTHGRWAQNIQHPQGGGNLNVMYAGEGTYGTSDANIDHGHSFVTGVENQSLSHNHSVPALGINADGGGNPHNNMPKWVGLLRIMKVKRV
jgi:hypothetical protein